jgi:hypothetical protein
MITPETIGIALMVAIGGVALVFGLLLLAPARTLLEVDTALGVARARIRPVWGMGPAIEFARRSSQGTQRSPIAKLVSRVRDLPRLANAALALPKLVRPIRRLLTDLDALKPSKKHIVLSAPPIHPVATLVLEVANGLPESVRRGVEVRTKDGLSVDFAARVEANAAPLTLWRMYRRFRGDEGVREFLRRLRKQPKDAA